MTGTDTGPKYYTPTYGLPRYSETDTESDPAAQRNWRAPGTGVGRLQWEALPERDTPYPWELQRPLEPWRHSTTVELPDGPMPAAPAPMAPPQPAAPLPPVQIEHPPSAANTGRIPYAKDAPAAAPQPFRTVDRRASQAPAPAAPNFPPPKGRPARPSGTVSPNAKKGKLPFISILTPLLVLIDPAAALVPLIAAMVLIAMSKQYRNPTSRVAWGVVVIVLTVAFLVIRAVAAF